jgi:hypothetical protein
VDGVGVWVCGGQGGSWGRADGSGAPRGREGI